MVISAKNGFHVWIIAGIFWCGLTMPGSIVSGAPIEIERSETPFPLELQPPLIDNLQDAVDSYGNPLKYSQPIQTPDGRKVVSAEGVQFEIPNYASGITEIKKPKDSLLPPFIDPIAVALPNDADSSLQGSDALQQQYTIPDWLADFNDPDVGPGVPYTPAADSNLLSVLSWDLVPPQKQDPDASSFTFGQQNQPSVTVPAKPFAFNQNVQVTTSRTTTTTTTTPRPTTTTPRPTTTTTTTTTTTPRPTTTTARPTTTTTTTASPYPKVVPPKKTWFVQNSREIYALPGGNSYTLPSWLEGYDDSELSVAVPFEVPEDNNEYNHTLSNDLLPPLEPFVDLKTINIPGLAGTSQTPSFAPAPIPTIPSTTTTTIRTTTTRTTKAPPTRFQFQFFSQQPVTPTPVTTQKTSFFTTAPVVTTTTTTTESPISNRIAPFTLNSAVQPTGFSSNTFTATSPTAPTRVKVTPPPRPVLNSNYNPFLSSRLGQTGFTSVPTPTTTAAPTTTTTEAFHFDSATIPSWLSDIKDPELGPGVPFTLTGSNDPNLVYNDLKPPTVQVDDQANNGVTIQKSISSEIPSFNVLQNSVLSQSASTIEPFTSTTAQEPSKLFTPPIVVAPDDDNNADSQSQTNSILNNNFPAATEPTTKTTSKITFNKSDQGKVISNSIFAPTQQPNKQVFGFAQPSSPSGFTRATTPNPFARTTTPSSFTGKYTGSFGGAPGFLGGQNKPGYAIQPDGSIKDPDHTVRPTIKQVVQPTLVSQPRIDVPVVAALPVPAPTAAAAGPKREYTGTFGGPPGILVPFDNVKTG